jgi:hypothetical protein
MSMDAPSRAERPGRIAIVLGIQLAPYVASFILMSKSSIPIDVTPHTWECQDPESFLHFSVKLPKTDLTPLDDGTYPNTSAFVG